LREFKSFSLPEVIIGASLIILAFLSFGEVKNTYLKKNGETIIREEEIRLASSCIEAISTYSSNSQIFNDFTFSNNSPLSNLNGDGFSAFTSVEAFSSQYNIPLSDEFKEKNYWIMCSKSTISYSSCDFVLLRVYIFREYKEKWLVTSLGRIIK